MDHSGRRYCCAVHLPTAIHVGSQQEGWANDKISWQASERPVGFHHCFSGTCGAPHAKAWGIDAQVYLDLLNVDGAVVGCLLMKENQRTGGAVATAEAADDIRGFQLESLMRLRRKSEGRFHHCRERITHSV